MAFLRNCPQGRLTVPGRAVCPLSLWAKMSYAYSMEKMKVWMAYFAVMYEGEFGLELFFNKEDAQKYLDENAGQYEWAGDGLECVLVEMEVN